VLEKLDKYVSLNVKYEDEVEQTETEFKAVKIIDTKGYIGNIYSADYLQEKYLIAGGTDCALYVYNMKKHKADETTIGQEFIIRQFKDEILFVQEINKLIYIIDIKLTLYVFESMCISSYSDKSGTGYLNPYLKTYDLHKHVSNRNENT